MMALYRCPENHVLNRTPRDIVASNGRTKCGWCHAVVTVVPCPEALPKPHSRRNEYSASIMRQRTRDNARRRALSAMRRAGANTPLYTQPDIIMREAQGWGKQRLRNRSRLPQ